MLSHRVHPLEVVIHHELQHVVGVTLVGLQQPVHHGPALQQLRRPLHQVWIVKVYLTIIRKSDHLRSDLNRVYLDKCVLARVVAIHGNS